MDAFERKLNTEKAKAFVEACVIHALLLYYLFAGGYYYLGLMMELEFDEFAYNSMVLIAFVPLSIVLGWLWSMSPDSPGRAFVERTSDFLKNTRVETPGNWFYKPSGILTILLLIETIALGWVITGISFTQILSSDGMSGARRLFGQLLSPEWSIINRVLITMVETIYIALMATLIAVPVAFVGSFFCARNLMKGNAGSLVLYNVLRLIFNFTRSVEPLIWAIIFSVWVGIGPFAGMLALMVHSVASLIKLYSEQIENIDRGPMEAIEATGANWVQVIWYAVVPQIVLPYLSFTIYRWDINVRMATIIGMVGGGGIGTLLMQYQGLAKWNEVGMIVIVIAIVVWMMDYLSARIREAIY